jgi:uncharacterized protein
MKLLIRSMIAAAVLVLFAQMTFAQLGLPQPQGMVSDFAGKLSPAVRGQLETLLIDFRDRSQIEVAVATIPFDDMQGYPIEEYSLQLGRQWGLGRGSEKNSLLLLVAIKEANSQGIYSGGTRLEVSRHLEGDIPDGLAGEIIRRIREDLKAGRFDQALTMGVQTVLATVAEKRGISLEGLNRGLAYRPAERVAERPRQGRRGISPFAIIVIIFVVFVIISAIGRGGRGGPGGRRRGRGGFDAGWMLIPLIFGGGGGWGGSSGHRGGSSWGGGSDWGGDGGGGGFGGFGGGGDFGGGGASDSW